MISITWIAVSRSENAVHRYRSERGLGGAVGGVEAIGDESSPEVTLTTAARGWAINAGISARSVGSAQKIDRHHRLRRSDIPGGQVLDKLDAGVVEHDIDVG